MSAADGPGGRFRTWSDTAGTQHLRIGDSEREAAANALGEHYATGRLSKEEYDERAAVVWDARTLAALQPVFADLPLPHGPLQPTSPPRAAGPLPNGRGRGFSFPWFPVLAGLVLLAVVTGHPWVLFVGIGVLLYAKSKRRHWTSHASSHAGGQTSGSCLGGRGTWR